MTAAPTTDVDPTTAQRMISDGKVIMVDVREHDEWVPAGLPVFRFDALARVAGSPGPVA